MSGATLTLAGVGPGAAGGVVIPGPLAWSNIFNFGAGNTNNQTLTLITVPISISISNSGTGQVQYIRNGAPVLYSGAFNVSAGDVLSWLIVNTGPSSVSGTITVRNQSSAGATLDVFTYTVKGGM